MKNLSRYYRPVLAFVTSQAKAWSRHFGPVLAGIVFLLAAWMLYRQFTLKDLRQIATSVHSLLTEHPWSIAAAVGLAVTNYIVLMGYDLLAVRYLGIEVPAKKVAFGAFTAYACGFNLGATFAGTSIRYRLYSSWGVSGVKILQLLIVLALTFWFGMLALSGTVFIFAPLTVPAKFCLPFHDTRPLGVLLLLSAVIYVALSFFFKGAIQPFGRLPCPENRTLAAVWRWKLPIPPFGLTVCQILIASLDLLLVAGVLYSLWPPSNGTDYFHVLDIYLFVFVIGVLTHVPGGYGVMEFILTTIIPGEGLRNEVLASWLLFRVIYFILPMCIAVVMLGWYELRLFKRGPSQEKEPISLPA